jgi:hypothetical protein
MLSKCQYRKNRTLKTCKIPWGSPYCWATVWGAWFWDQKTGIIPVSVLTIQYRIGNTNYALILENRLKKKTLQKVHSNRFKTVTEETQAMKYDMEMDDLSRKNSGTIICGPSGIRTNDTLHPRDAEEPPTLECCSCCKPCYITTTTTKVIEVIHTYSVEHG